MTNPRAKEIANFYGGEASGDTARIPTPGHSTRDRGTGVRIDPTAPGGLLVHCFNGDRDEALAVKEMLRADGFWDDGDPPISDGADAALRDAIRKSHAEKLRAEREAARRAESILANAHPANPVHPYLVAKHIPPERLWQANDWLLVPLTAPDGHLWNLQFIDNDGSKRFMPGGRIKGLFWFAGKPEGVICIGEGMATMAAVRRATGYNIIAALSASNLPLMAKIARERSPDALLLIAADDDEVGMKAAREASALTGARIVAPKGLLHA